MPKVVIAASGMMTGGRVLHHIEAFGGDRKNTILFAGYQAAGTRGAKILEGARTVQMFGQEFTSAPKSPACPPCQPMRMPMN